MTWYLYYPLSYRDLEEMFRKRGFEVDHGTINHWVLGYGPSSRSGYVSFAGLISDQSGLIEETYVKIL